MGKASKDGVPKERAEKPKGGVDWSQHEQLYKKMKDEEKSLKQWNPLEDIRVQFVVGVATALFLTYHAFTAGGITQLTKANTIEAFKTGEPWLVLCDKQPVKAAVTKEPIGVDFAEAADRLTDIGVQSGVLNCWGKLSTGQTAMKKYGLKPHGSKPFIFLMDPDFKVKKTGTLKPIQLGSKDMKSADKVSKTSSQRILDTDCLLTCRSSRSTSFMIFVFSRLSRLLLSKSRLVKRSKTRKRKRTQRARRKTKNLISIRVRKRAERHRENTTARRTKKSRR
jgi:hypothetical protein